MVGRALEFTRKSRKGKKEGYSLLEEENLESLYEGRE
jgi:hypothetical protein